MFVKIVIGINGYEASEEFKVYVFVFVSWRRVLETVVVCGV